MVQSPSWEAKWFAASKEIPRISRNPKVHYRTHKRPPPVPKRILASSYLSVRPHGNNSVSIGRIFMKIDIWEFSEKSVVKI